MKQERFSGAIQVLHPLFGQRTRCGPPVREVEGHQGDRRETGSLIPPSGRVYS